MSAPIVTREHATAIGGWRYVRVQDKMASVVAPHFGVGRSTKCTGPRGAVRVVDEAPDSWAGMGEL